MRESVSDNVCGKWKFSFLPTWCLHSSHLSSYSEGRHITSLSLLGRKEGSLLYSLKNTSSIAVHLLLPHTLSKFSSSSTMQMENIIQWDEGRCRKEGRKMEGRHPYPVGQTLFSEERRLNERKWKRKESWKEKTRRKLEKWRKEEKLKKMKREECHCEKISLHSSSRLKRKRKSYWKKKYHHLT